MQNQTNFPRIKGSLIQDNINEVIIGDSLAETLNITIGDKIKIAIPKTDKTILGNFVVLDEDGYIYKSQKGYKWGKNVYGVDQGIFKRKNLKNIIHENDIYLTYGNDGTILYSSNGTYWDKINIGNNY